MFGYARVEYSVPPFSERREPSWLIRRGGQTLPPPSPLKSEAGLFSLCCKNRIETVWLEDCSRSRRGGLRSGGLMEPRMPELGGRRFAGSGRQAENCREALGHPASVRCAGEAIRAPSVIADPAACCLRSLQHRGPTIACGVLPVWPQRERELACCGDRVLLVDERWHELGAVEPTD